VRENKKLVSRLTFANLRQSAVVEDTDMKASRGLDKALFAKLERAPAFLRMAAGVDPVLRGRPRVLHGARARGRSVAGLPVPTDVAQRRLMGAATVTLTTQGTSTARSKATSDRSALAPEVLVGRGRDCGEDSRLPDRPLCSDDLLDTHRLNFFDLIVLCATQRNKFQIKIRTCVWLFRNGFQNSLRSQSLY
jgi:hypothetical protein